MGLKGFFCVSDMYGVHKRDLMYLKLYIKYSFQINTASAGGQKKLKAMKTNRY